MTFAGFMILVANFGLLAYYDWDFSAAERSLDGPSVIPAWVWISCGLGTFVVGTRYMSLTIASYHAADGWTVHYSLPRGFRMLKRSIHLLGHVPGPVWSCMEVV